MMKITKPFNQLVLSVCCVLASGSAFADEFNYPKNPIERPITLPDGMVSLSAAAGYVEQFDGDEEGFIVPGVQYGVTDNFTIGLDGLTYRFFNDDGLQLGANFGVRDADDSDTYGERAAVGLGFFGKKVINSNFALTFGVDFIHWDEEIIEDRSEVNYDLGLMYNIAPDWTVGVNYTYRDIEDFSQDSASRFLVSLNYAYSDSVDVGLFVLGSEYEDDVTEHYLYDEVENGAGIYVNWRF